VSVGGLGFTTSAPLGRVIRVSRPWGETRFVYLVRHYKDLKEEGRGEEKNMRVLLDLARVLQYSGGSSRQNWLTCRSLGRGEGGKDEAT